MTDIDRYTCSEQFREDDTPGRDGREGPVCYSFIACVRCPVPEERLLGGVRPAPRRPTIRVLPRPEAGGVTRR
jgi:hypothetical protein